MCRYWMMKLVAPHPWGLFGLWDFVFFIIVFYVSLQCSIGAPFRKLPAESLMQGGARSDKNNNYYELEQKT